MKILDCTLRDGGYYTNWDFDDKIVDAYIRAMNLLPIDYLELGYRNLPSVEYMGKFGYSPVSILKKIREHCTKKLDVRKILGQSIYQYFWILLWGWLI